MWGKGQECLGCGWNKPPVNKALTRPGYTETKPIGYMKNKGEITGMKKRIRIS